MTVLTLDEARAELAKRGYSLKEFPRGRSRDANGQPCGPIIYEWNRKRNAPTFPGMPECGCGLLEAVHDWVAYHDELKRWPRHGGQPQEHLTSWEKRALRPPDPRDVVRRRAERRYCEAFLAGEFSGPGPFPILLKGYG
jgi:hypothetical protein